MQPCLAATRVAVGQSRGGAGPCQPWPWGRCPAGGTAGAWPGGPLGTRLRQGLHARVAACAVSAWHCDPIACAQEPGRASPGITPWEQECRALAARITGSLSPMGPGPGSKPPSEGGSQAAQPRLTPAHTAEALQVVLPSAGAAGGHACSPGLGGPQRHGPAPCAGAPAICISPCTTAARGICTASLGARRRCQPQLSQQAPARRFLLWLPWAPCQAWLPLQQPQPRSGVRVRATQPRCMGRLRRSGTGLARACTYPGRPGSVAPGRAARCPGKR